MASNQSNVPIEMIEAEYPVRIERYGLVADTGGTRPAAWGVGLLREYRALEEGLSLSVRSDKRTFPPHGLGGGDAGAPCVSILAAGGRNAPCRRSSWSRSRFVAATSSGTSWRAAAGSDGIRPRP